MPLTKHIVLQFYAGGGVNGLSQIMMAEASEKLSGVMLRDVVDITAAGSVGNFTALTSLQKRINPDISVFTPLRETFKTVAKETMCGTKRQEQLVNGVTHDIYHALNAVASPFVDTMKSGIWGRFTQSVKNATACAVLKDRTGAIHLDPTLLSDMVTQSFGDMSLNDLKSPYISYALDKNKADFLCFSNLQAVETPFLTSGWSDAILTDKGGDYKLRDVVLSSIAAPTLFESHEAGGDHFIDCASFQSPLGVVRNILRMSGQDTHIHVLYMGTGRQDRDVLSPQKYNNLGAIQSQRSYISDIAMATLKREMKELHDIYSEQVTVHQIDAVFPNEYKGHDFIRDQFNGSDSYLNVLEELTEDYIVKNEGNIRQPFEVVAEAREKASIQDPTIARVSVPALQRLGKQAAQRLGSLIVGRAPA